MMALDKDYSVNPEEIYDHSPQDLQ